MLSFINIIEKGKRRGKNEDVQRTHQAEQPNHFTLSRFKGLRGPLGTAGILTVLHCAQTISAFLKPQVPARQGNVLITEYVCGFKCEHQQIREQTKPKTDSKRYMKLKKWQHFWQQGGNNQLHC